MDVPEPVKKYWPYMLGGVVGLYVIVKMSGGSSSSGGSSDYASLLAAQSAASTQNAAIGAQQEAARADRAMQQQAIQAAQAIESAKVSSAAAVSLMQAQGQVAKDVGSAASGIIGALQAPSIAAINANAAENVSTMESAAAAQIASYAATTQHIASVAEGSKTYAMAIADSARSTVSAVNSSNSAIVGQQQALRPSDTPVKGNSYSGTIGLVSGAMSLFSDADVKINVQPVSRSSVDDISRIEFVEFDYDISKTGPQIKEHFDVGTIAQQCAGINPSWTFVDEGFLKLYMPAMLMSALHAISELKAEIVELKTGKNDG